MIVILLLTTFFLQVTCSYIMIIVDVGVIIILAVVQCWYFVCVGVLQVYKGAIQ